MIMARLFLLLLLLPLAAASAEKPTPAPAPGEAPKPAAPTPIAIPDIADQAETLATRLREVQNGATTDPAMKTVADGLPALTREIDDRLLEHRRILAQRPPLEMMRSLEAGWRRERETLTEWARDLSRSEARGTRDLEQLDQLEKTWLATRQAAPPEAASEVLARIDAQLAAIRSTREHAERHRSQVVALQGRVAVQEARVGEALATLKQARDEMVSQLMVKDSLALWDPDLVTGGVQPLDEQVRASLATQLSSLGDYARRTVAPFLLHAAVFALIVACFYAARGAIARWVPHEPELTRTALVFQTPIATALVVTLFAVRWIYPEAPRLLWAIFGALALIPTAYILRRLVHRELRPTLYLLVAFYFIDQLRAVLAALQLLPRLLFVGEMLAAATFTWWLLHDLRHPRGDPSADRLRLTMKLAVLVSLVACVATLIANVTGYVRLANLIGNSMLVSAYFGLILYVMVAILDGLATIALRVGPLNALGMVQRHRIALRHRIRQALQWAAIVLWALFTLERLTVRDRLFGAVRSTLSAEAVVGSLRLSLGDVLAFALTVWAAFIVSRLVRFLLEEDVYPRVHLARGLPYAISTMAHYVILVVGFFAAVAALGFDMTKATILAGAFTVGVGFGLQNIFNNFVSGLILLFERPVKVGDVIEMDPSSTGVVERIGIRASVIRAANGAELIVPNGKLISDRFTNWTFSSRTRSIEVPVSVVLAADPEKAIQTLERAAAEHPKIIGEPPPKAIVTRLGPDWMGLELRAWTNDAADWMQIRSDITVRAAQALTAAGITLR
ncbi:MAG: mechanosensitive ion channel domain-containing protein [Rhodospirillaceae bacterium]